MQLNIPPSLLPPDIYGPEHARQDAANLFACAPNRAAWGDYYLSREAMVAARAELLKVAAVLGITHHAIRPTEEGRLCVAGKAGIIRHQQGTTCKLILGRHSSKRGWQSTVDQLRPAMHVRLNCDHEGVFVFAYDDPRVIELAPVIRHHGRFRMAMSPERVAALSAAMAARSRQSPEEPGDED